MSTHRVFVYGSLKKGYGNHYLLEGSLAIGPAKLEPKYSMYSLGGFPAVGLDGDTAITGEVYEVDDRTMLRLDNLEGYPDFYNRLKVETAHGEAWMYYIEDCSRFSNIVENGVW